MAAPATADRKPAVTGGVSGPRPRLKFKGPETVDCTVIQHETPTAPVRTCIGCRKRELAVDLLRVAAVRDGDGKCAVSVDSAGNLPGRGAWLHPVQQCLDAAVRRRAFARALRITGSPDTSEVEEFFSALSA